MAYVEMYVWTPTRFDFDQPRMQVSVMDRMDDLAILLAEWQYWSGGWHRNRPLGAR